MPKRTFRPEDAYLIKSVADVDLSPDGRRAAFVVGRVNQDADRLESSVWVVPADGSAPPRPFTDGPADKSPRWSPDGRWLAYISVTDDKPMHAHIRLAPLDGGAPRQVGELPGPVSQIAWSPDSTRLAVVCRVGAPDPEPESPAQRNSPRVVRGLAARLDGVGWQDGRRQVYVVEIEGGRSRQLTRGEYDHADPAFSPDGELVVFASDRSAARDDRQFSASVCVVPAAGGRVTKLTGDEGSASFPQFSPDGSLIAFAGKDSDPWDRESRLYVVAADGSAAPKPIAPDCDRGVLVFPGLPAPFAWIGGRELAVQLVDRGCIHLYRARVGERRARLLIGGGMQMDGLSARAGKRTVLFSAAWPDRPSELYATNLSGDEPLNLSHLNDDFLAQVQLSPLTRSTIKRPDGFEIEYFTLLPPGSGRRAGRLPVHVDIHGGPHGLWPAGRFLAFHQSIAAAGFAVMLPNPRGSTSYGQQFTSACTGDWGGADYEDILACCDDLVARGIGDANRFFVSGGSYGGFMTSWIVGHTDRFRAATAAAAVIDQTSMAFTTEIPGFVLFSMGGQPWERGAEYEKRSPLTYLPRVKTPVLVIHWEGDLRVPVSQGEELYAGLRLLGKPTEFVRYPGGFHIMRTPSQAVDWVSRMIEWDQRHDPAAGRRKKGT